MRSVVRTYGKNTRIKVLLIVFAVFSLLLFIIGICVHDHAKGDNTLRFLDFKDGKNYDPTDICEFKEKIASGEYLDYDNIYVYDCPTDSGEPVVKIDHSNIVYSSTYGLGAKNLLFIGDDTLPEKTIMFKMLICNKVNSLTENDFVCKAAMGKTNTQGLNNVIFGEIRYKENNTTRFSGEEIVWVDDKNFYVERTGRYNVEPTYITIEYSYQPLGNKSYVNGGKPTGWGLTDNRPNLFYDVIVVYYSPDIVITECNSESWDYDALGI